MPLPSSENDLKRRARRRLIGAVALIVLAVIVLPLLLEDEPPPASSLAVRMAVVPTPVPIQAVPPAATEEPVVEVPMQAAPAETEPTSVPLAKPELPPAPKPEPVKPAPVRPPAKPAPVAPPAPPPPVPAKALVPESEKFVVQLAALSDTDKAEALKKRAGEAGLPAFTDKVGNLTRVRVGPFPTRSAAVAAAVKLAEHDMAGQVLIQ